MGKRLLKRAGIGFLLGVAAGILIPWLMIHDHSLVSQLLLGRAGGKEAALFSQLLFSGLYGAATMSGTLLYEIERWPLALATLAHYAIVAGLYVPLAFLCGWANSPEELIISEAFQFAAFFLIWLIIDLRYKAEVKKLNELQEQSKTKKEKGEKR